MKNENKTMNLQMTLYTSSSQENYGVSFVTILRKNDCVTQRFDCKYQTMSLLTAVRWHVYKTR